MKKNDKIQLEIIDISVDGEGVGKLEGFPFFVKNAITGDKVLAVITKIKKNYGYAKVIKIVEPSPWRVMPACERAEKCGGCQIMPLAYEKQLEFKETRVKHELVRTGGLSFEEKNAPAFHPIIGMDGNRLYFRNKMQIPVGISKDGRVIAGFYAGRTHYIVESAECIVAPEEAAGLVKSICQFIEEHDISVYDEKSNKGLVRHIMIRKGFRTGQIMVCLVINGKELCATNAHRSIYCKDSNHLDIEKNIDHEHKKILDFQVEAHETMKIITNQLENLFVKRLLESIRVEKKRIDAANINIKADEISVTGHIKNDENKDAEDKISICLNYNERQTNVIMGPESRCLYGHSYIEDILSIGMEGIKDLRFKISPLSFYQVNSIQAEKLYAKAMEYADLKGVETVWDLYCGIGTISLFLAQKAKKVYGVEIVPQAIADAKENARINGIENVDFICGDSAEVFVNRCADETKRSSDNDRFSRDECHEVRERVDVVVIDPPRKGCDKKLLDSVLKVASEKIIYISCDPATLARDIKILTQEESLYKVDHIQPVDVFLNTYHCEVVALMSRVKD